MGAVSKGILRISGLGEGRGLLVRRVKCSCRITFSFATGSTSGNDILFGSSGTVLCRDDPGSKGLTF